MKSHSKPKAAAGGGARAAFELKHRVALALNKLADRDTQQIGTDELERAAEGLTPETIAPFLSCVADTDADQKSAVRKECVRIMGTLARSHGALLDPHLAKMAAGIVKRLKDPDSVVRDACVEAAGVMATSVRGSGVGEGTGGGGFVTLAKPLFEALGEQNRYVQAGSALCLARVIDEAVDPPVGILPQMLARVVKLLKNPHFMAKPAVIELIRSIVQAGGASTEHTLSAAVTSILEALKNSDWTTRKAASLALADIAVTGEPLLGSFKASCIRSLESCRFDKVKPVRDAIMHAIQCWKTLSASHSPEPSEAGSSTKENFAGDYPDFTSASDGGSRDTSFRKAGPVSALTSNSISSIKKRTPLMVKKSPDCVHNRQYVKPNDWHVEIALPRSRTIPSVELQHEESGGSCTTKAFDGAPHATEGLDMQYDYESKDNKPDRSSLSDLVSVCFETKHVTVDNGCLEEGSPAGDIDSQGHRLRDRKSLDSNVTESCSRVIHECCLHKANELSLIRKQLLEIETKQSNLMDLLQVFMGNSMDGLSSLQLKVNNLEHTVDKIAQGIIKNENNSSLLGSKLLKKNQSVTSSPRLSTCSSRPSVDANRRHLPALSTKNREMWRENASSKSRSSTVVKDGDQIWRDPTMNIIINPIGKGIQRNTGRDVQISGSTPTKGANDLHSASARGNVNRHCIVEGKASLWKQIKDSIYAGDVDCAYVKALCSGDDLNIIKLMDRTGPVLERLSLETASEVLSTLAPHFLNRRFMDSIIPWLQQVVNLSSGHERRHFVLPTKPRMEFLLAVEEMSALEFADPIDRTTLAQLAAKLKQVWGEARKMHPTLRNTSKTTPYMMQALIPVCSFLKQ